MQVWNYKIQLLSLISCLEIYLNKVSKTKIRSLDADEFNELTLYHLRLVYLDSLKQHNGMNGFCFENFIYNTILFGDYYINTQLNQSINLISNENNHDKLNVILWGGEKSDILLSSEKIKIKEGDLIWTPVTKYIFRDYIDCIEKAFYYKEFQENLPSDLKNIWKADLFVKKENSNTWYAVTIKSNPSDMKKVEEIYNGLHIGIYLDNNNNNNIYPFINNYFVKCIITDMYFVNNYNTGFKLVNDTLEELPKIPICSTNDIRKIMQFIINLYKKNIPCIKIINYLKTYYFIIYNIENLNSINNIIDCFNENITKFINHMNENNNYIYGMSQYINNNNKYNNNYYRHQLIPYTHTSIPPSITNVNHNIFRKVHTPIFKEKTYKNIFKKI